MRAAAQQSYAGNATPQTTNDRAGIVNNAQPFSFTGAVGTDSNVWSGTWSGIILKTESWVCREKTRLKSQHLKGKPIQENFSRQSNIIMCNFQLFINECNRIMNVLFNVSKLWSLYRAIQIQNPLYKKGKRKKKVYCGTIFLYICMYLLLKKNVLRILCPINCVACVRSFQIIWF